jgi:hypothetical protein
MVSTTCTSVVIRSCLHAITRTVANITAALIHTQPKRVSFVSSGRGGLTIGGGKAVRHLSSYTWVKHQPGMITFGQIVSWHIHGCLWSCTPCHLPPFSLGHTQCASTPARSYGAYCE